MQLNNTYEACTAAQFEQYIRELAIFGANTIEFVPPGADDVSPKGRAAGPFAAGSFVFPAGKGLPALPSLPSHLLLRSRSPLPALHLAGYGGRERRPTPTSPASSSACASPHALLPESGGMVQP
jgi:hypothetical protein